MEGGCFVLFFLPCRTGSFTMFRLGKLLVPSTICFLPLDHVVWSDLCCHDSHFVFSINPSWSCVTSAETPRLFWPHSPRPANLRPPARPGSSSEGRGPSCVIPGDITIFAVLIIPFELLFVYTVTQYLLALGDPTRVVKISDLHHSKVAVQRGQLVLKYIYEIMHK